MNNQDKEIKKANRKALPVFILTLVLSLLAGGVLGYFSSKFEIERFADDMKNAGAFFGINIAPWLILALAVILPFICAALYSKAKKLLAVWDGEDEAVSDAVDAKLSTDIWLSSAALIFSFFLIAAAYSPGIETFDKRGNIVAFLIAIGGFFAILIETIIIQQKCVDAAKKMNPEKDASVYDMKFQKKWMDSCDEAEKIVIGKCAFKAYSATNSICMTLAVLLAIGALMFGIGFLPSFAVCLIWIVNQSAYCKEAMKYSKAGNKIS